MTRLVTTLGEARRLAGDLVGFLCVVAALASPVSARAGPPVINSEPTNLSGNAELMISYRHQERMWQTSDGGLHLVVNRGTSQGNPALVLNSSFDGGVTWITQVTFANTNRDTTADGTLQGSLLALVYATADGGVSFAQLSYDSALRTWTGQSQRDGLLLEPARRGQPDHRDRRSGRRVVRVLRSSTAPRGTSICAWSIALAMASGSTPGWSSARRIVYRRNAAHA